MSKKKKYKVLENSQEPCPRCGRLAEAREHKQVDAKVLSQPFYFSRWHCCKNTSCNTNIFTQEKYKVTTHNVPSDLVMEILDELPKGKEETPPWE